jgi:hypothetical protein
MKKKNDFLDLISEENKSKVFRRDLAESVSSADNDRYNSVAESPEYVESYRKLAERVIPAIDVRDPSTFAIYGSAERYYEDSFTYIYNSYPYDGSALEKINWSLSASAVDLAILQHEYPFETGHVTVTGDDGWGSVSSTSGIYGLSDAPEYIKFSGGPYVGTVYDSDTNRGSSLKIDPSSGNTVEFWLKKNSFVESLTRSEIVFDSHTIDFAEGNAKYGRFLLELSASSEGSPFYLTYMSGTTGADRQRIGNNIASGDIADGAFHHYAFAVHHTGSNLKLELYVDGKHNHTVNVAAASFGAVSGYFNASIGALRTEKDSNGGLGYGKLSGSIDEFRFWKERRTAEDIHNYYDFPVNGATDDEPIDSVLGVYYKFNEGTVGDDSKDKVVLDYSGRLNNGEFVGYNSSTRVSTSAITLSSETTQVELGDPIIDKTSSRVTTALSEFLEIGKAYDEINHSSLMKSVPQWAYDHGAGSNNVDSDFTILLQAIGQKFDSIRMLIDGLPKIGFARYRDFVYAQGSVGYQDNFYNVLGCEREYNFDFKEVSQEESFSVQNLLGRGFTIEESPITNRANLNQYLYNLKFDISDPKTSLSQAFAHSKVEDLKSKILNTIHVNISNIFKTKGTSQSFRNLIRCFGVDDNLVAPNVYAQNVERTIVNEPVFEAIPIKSLSFTGSNNSMTLHQTASNSLSDERAYVESKTSQLSMTVEGRTLFPHILDLSKTATTSSVFGMNSVSGSDLIVTNPNNAGMVVRTLKSNISNKGCYFSLTSSTGMFSELKSPYFNEVYSNTPWYLAVKFSEDTASPLLDSDVRSNPSYKVEFVGYRYDLDVETSTFHVSASISETNYLSFMGSNKSFFLGANRTQLTGTVINTSDIKALSFSVWDDALSTEEMKEHAKSISNIGRENPLFRREDNKGGSRTRSESLVMNWQFDDVVYSDTSTNYFYDHSSGSVDKIRTHGSISGYKYPATTLGLEVQSGSIQQEYLPNIKYVSPDNLVSRSKVQAKDREIEVFELDSRPVTYLYSYEKSLYQVISKEMLNMIAGATAFNNLIGEPVYKYRLEYKSLEKLRDHFFARVENNIDLERFIEYYKWIDSSLGLMLQQLQPATSDMNLGLEDVVESHVFERNKYRHQPPQLEYKDPNLVGQILGVNELLYDWEHGHAPEPVFWASLDGTDDYIAVPDHDDLSFGDASSDSVFSLSAWVVFTDPTSSIQAIMGKYNSNTASEYLFFNNNGYLQINLYDLNTANKIQSKTNSVVFEDGRLYHVAMVYDGTTTAAGITLYIDGVEIAQTRSTSGTYTAMHNTSVDFQIGSTVAGSFDFARNMHHVMVIANDLTSADVTSLYNLYENGILNVTSTTFSDYANITSWWKMDREDFTSGIVNDSKGSHNGTFNGDAKIVSEYSFFNKEAENCLWWQDRAERDGILSISDNVDSDREEIRSKGNTVVSGSTYVLRKLARPYRFAANHQRLLNVGSNRKANKNKTLYRPVINSGQEIQINSSDIYEFKQCDDVLDPQEEKIYTAKTDTTGTSGYLDADADMILPLSLYSSSAGTDFSIFKSNLSITNNHDDEAPSFQGPFVAEHVGGMPHRRVKFGTLDDERAEAYILSASSTTLTLKQSDGPRSITPRGLGVQSVYNVANIMNNTSSSSGAGPLLIGNYDKDYEIVLTNGRSLNNVYLVESGSIDTAGSLSTVQGMIDYTSPVRGRAEHIIVNKFSSPGGPETQGVYGRDKESGEFSIYNTLNYRNLSIRNPLNKLSAEKSDQFGYRSGSTTQASLHMTNRNYFHVTNSSGQVSVPDNHFVQHAIPQNDFGYSWIPAAANISKFEFVKRNAGFGHQHNLGSTASVAFDALPATAILVFTAAGAVNADAELALTASDGTSVNFNAISGSLTGSHQFNVSGSLSPGAIAANSLATQIDREFGFTSDLFGRIQADYVAVASDNVQVQLTQLTAGAAGNTTIESSLDNVTAPAAFTGGRDAGFESYRSESSIEFLTASVLGSYYQIYTSAPSIRGRVFGMETASWPAAGPNQYSRFIPVDFVGLNTIIAEPVDEDTNTLGTALTWTDVGQDISAVLHGTASLVNQTFVGGVDGGPSLPGFAEGNTTKLGLAGVLNSIVLNRQGPSGWPTWKQIRGGNHPVIRAHKKSNTFSRVFMGDPDVGVSSIEKSENTPSMNVGARLRYGRLDPNGDAYARARSLETRGPNGDGTFNVSRMVKNYTDVVATNRFAPSRVVFHMAYDAPSGRAEEIDPTSDPRLPQFFRRQNTSEEEDGKLLALSQRTRESNWFFDKSYYRTMGINPSKVAVVNQTFQNDWTSFANMDIVDDIKYKENRSQFYLHPDPLSTAGNTQRSPGFLKFADSTLRSNEQERNALLEISYLETIYPREINTFTENARERTLFDYFPWKENRDSRELILTGNIAHDTGSTDSPLYVIPKLRAFTRFTSTDSKDYKKSFYGSYDIINMGIEFSGSTILQINSYITASTWPLDARKDFSQKPKDIGRSFFTLDMKYLTASSDSQGIRGEGILQNDFSTFPLGYNNVYGTPPFSTVYNRRMPQEYGTASYLSGEAKWQTADDDKGPFYDTYDDYCKHIKLVAPDHSLVPEFRMSEFVEDVLDGTRSYPNIGDDWLILTGAIYVNSEGDANVGGTFYKTYSNSDFLKYFQMYDEELAGDQADPTNNLNHARINFRCKAAMKFLPYKGFYPADRATEITEIFNRHYLNSDVIRGATYVDQGASGMPEEYAQRYGNLRANASKYQVTKPFFGPGILFNSIKAGVAVDYPIFSSSLSNAYANMPSSSALTDFADLSISAASSFTGSIINGTVDGGVARIKDVVTKRIEFEDILSPGNLHRENIFDNEPHPSASLLYGTDDWHRIVERPAIFGDFDNGDSKERLGLSLDNTKDAFIRQLSPYTLAMQNFAAETVNFFVKDGHLTTAISKPIKERFVKDVVYKMRVRLTNIDTSMYDRHSAFGPPVDDGGDGVTLTRYTAGSTGTAAALDFTNTNWETLDTGAASAFKSINTEDANNILPKISFTGEGGDSGSITFYYSSTYSPKSATASSGDFVAKRNDIYIDLDGTTTGTGVATLISNHWNASASANPGWELNLATNAATSSFTSNVIGVRTNLAWSFDTWKYSGVSYNFEGVFVSGAVGSLNFSTGSDPSDTWTSSTETSTVEHGFMPYVPPFLDPGADPYVEISFTPSETKEFGAKEIIENCSFTYYNFQTAPDNAATNTNYINSMSLSASLNLGILAQLRTDNVEAIAPAPATNEGQKSKLKDIARFDVDSSDKLSRWVIQTKWETPVLDFMEITGSALDLSTETVTAVSGSPWKTKYWDSYYERGRANAAATSGTFLTSSTGMWHQKGRTLTNQDSKGYFLEVEDVPTAAGDPGLAIKLGFDKENEDSAAGLKRAKKYRNRVGPIENRKLVKEAIVAIPYVVRADKDNAIEFIKFKKEMYEVAQKNVDSLKFEMENKPLTDEIRTIDEYRRFLKEMDFKTKTYQFDSPIDAIEYQLFMMEEYILPPQLDFLRSETEFQNNSVGSDDGFMMYFFQFHASFDADDIANIWQNLYPKSADSTAGARYSYENKKLAGRIRPHGDISYTSHYLETLDLVGMDLCPAEEPQKLFSPADPNNKTRWLVFKVKQRGMANLEDVRKSSLDPRRANIEKFEYLKNSKSSFDRLSVPEDIPGRQESGKMNLQFNWPYDYFSFVELIKLETKIDSYNYTKNE